MWREFFILLLIIAANGFFALAELAILSANRTRLKLMAKRGVRGAALAIALAEDADHFLPAVQSCITLLAAGAGVFSGAIFADKLGMLINMIPGLAPHGTSIALPFIVVMVSYFSLVLGELVPKQLAVNNTERWAARVAPFMAHVVRWLTPVVIVLRVSTQIVLKIFPGHKRRLSGVSEEEVQALVDEGTQGGVFEVAEQQMIRRVLRLADRPVRSIMTARGDIDWLDVNADPRDLTQQMREARHSTYPVCDGSLDHVVGVVRAKDLLDQAYGNHAVNLRAVMEEITIFPETASILTVLEKLKQTSIHMGFIVDEYGVVEGIVTELDILEAIVGELPDDDEDTPAAAPSSVQTPGEVILDGAVATDEVKEQLALSDLPGEEIYHTLGGIALGQIGRIPRAGDGFAHAGWQFEIVEMEGRRVNKILARRIDSPGTTTGEPVGIPKN